MFFQQPVQLFPKRLATKNDAVLYARLKLAFAALTLGICTSTLMPRADLHECSKFRLA